MRERTRISLTTTDLADIFNTSLSSVRRMISEGSLKLTGDARRDFFVVMHRLNRRNYRVSNRRATKRQ